MHPERVNSNLVLSNIADAVIATDTNGLITFINPAGKKMLALNEGDNALAALASRAGGMFEHAFRRSLQNQQQEECRCTAAVEGCAFDITFYPAQEGVTVFFKKIKFTGDDVALRLQTEKDLSDKIINSLPGVFYMADTTPRLIRWNRAFESISGYSAEELKEMVPIELFDTRDHPAFKESMARALTDGTAQVEARLISKDGTSTPFYFTGVRISYDGKTVLLGSGIDMTAQKKAAEEIRLSSERYYLTTMATNDMIWDWNLVNNEIWWNNNYNKLIGYPENINLHHIQSWVNGIHPDDKERVTTGIYKIINSGEKFWADRYRYRKNDGTVIHVSDRGYVTHDENGKPVRMIGSMHDITERLKTENELRQKEERYRNLFEGASDSIVVHDMQGRILDMNFAAEGFSGYTKDQLKRMNVTDLLFAEDLKKLPIPFERLKAGETTYSKRRVKTQSGVVRIMELSSRMLPDGNVMAILRDITQKTEAEKALRNSELRFRMLTANVPVGIFETDTDGETTYVNEKMLEYTAVSFDELMKTGWLSYIHPDDRQPLIDSWKYHVEKKEESAYQYRIVSKYGDIRWVQGKAIPVYDKNGEFNGYLGTVSDITKEKLSQIALADSEEKYRTLVEQASDAIYIVNDQGRVVTVNPAATRLSGYTEAELLRMNIMDFVFEEDLRTNPLRFDELKKGKTVIVERRFRIKNEQVLDVECLANMMSDGRILVFARDNTERVRTRNELLKEKNFSDSIINSLPGIFYLFDQEGRFLRWNKNFEYISGYSADQLASMQPVDFFDEADRELIRDNIGKVFAEGSSEVEAMFLTRDKGKIPYYFNGWRVIFENRQCLIGVGIDLTEKKKNEALLLQSYEDIRRLASHLTWVREEERKRIGREIHDELGQQLTAIKMDMAWIEKRTPEESEQIRKKIKNVIALLDGGNKAVRRILTELSAGINDNHGLLEALERLNRQFEATTGIPVEFTTAEQVVQLSLEIANGIFRVYQESLTNIMRYAEAGKVMSSLKIENGMVHIRISDDGKGFDTATIPAKNSFGILGMKERVLSLQGKFEIKSVIGKGTTVFISVPYRQN